MHAGPARCVLFDWGDTLMRDLPGFPGPMAAWPRVEVLPHAREALDALRAQGWLTALATNAADSDEPQIREALRRGGLDDAIDRIYCARRIGHRKPEAAFFRAILADLGLEPPAAVMVGDDFATDVAGANAAGLRAVWLHAGDARGGAGEMYRTIRGLASLAEVLESWGAADPASDPRQEAAMFCPQCGAEYRAEAVECSECHVALVTGPPAAPGPEPAPEWVDLVTVLRASDPAAIAVAKSVLEAAGIACIARGEALQELFALGRVGGFNPVPGPVEIQVRRESEEEARALLEGIARG